MFFPISRPDQAGYSADPTMIDVASRLHDALGRSDTATGHAAAFLAARLGAPTVFRSVNMAPFFAYDGEDFATVLNLVPLNAMAEARRRQGRPALRARLSTWQPSGPIPDAAQKLLAEAMGLPEPRLMQVVSALVDFTKRCAIVPGPAFAAAWAGIKHRHLDERLVGWLQGFQVSLTCAVFDSAAPLLPAIEVTFDIGEPLPETAPAEDGIAPAT